MLQDEWLDQARADEIARKVREELARRRISRQALADLARISLSTLEKALAGSRSFTLATVIRLEEALGTSLRGTAPPAVPAQAYAAEELGAYARGAVRWLEGRYLTLRPLFTGEEGVYSYVTAIAWDEERSHLVFAESEREDASFAQHGNVSMPHLSGHIYLVTAEGGQYRLAILAARPSPEASTAYSRPCSWAMDRSSFRPRLRSRCCGWRRRRNLRSAGSCRATPATNATAPS